MKGKLFKTAIASVLAVTMLFTGCGGGAPASEYENVENHTDADISYPDTATVFSDNGASDYQIVVSAKHGWEVGLAMDDLQQFIEESTGARIPIVFDTDMTFDANQKRIILGRCDVALESGLSLDYDELGRDGFKIKTFGNSVVIAGATDYGSTFGVYDFLWYNFGVRFYASNEYKVPNLSESKVYLKNFDHKNVPDFAERASGINEKYNDITCYRLGQNRSHGENWYTWCHTYFQLLPPATYAADHPDWYYPKSGTPSQLCLTNEEMKDQLFENIKEIITANTARSGGLFMIGHEDNTRFCDCETCTAVAEANGGNSGVMMIFINDMARRLNEWMEETRPDDTIKWITFAYGSTVDAPLKKNADGSIYKNADGSYEPYNDAVKPEKNVGLMIAPLGCDWYHDMTDPVHNERYRDMMLGWQALGVDVYVYSYSVVFDSLFIHMDEWSTLRSQYKLWLDMGCKFIFEEGSPFANTPFLELVDYVHSRLLWDVDCDIEYYINDFMENYYKAAAPYAKKYLDLVRTRYQLIERTLNARGERFELRSFSYNMVNILTEEYWPKDWLLSAINLFDEALEACKSIESPEIREKVEKRVKLERLSPIFILMQLYLPVLPKADIRTYIDEFSEGTEMNGLVYFGHLANSSVAISTVIGQWRAALEEN